MKKALITGISGQTGSYLAEILLEKDYEVHGIVRRHSIPENQTTRIEHLRDKITNHHADVCDSSSLLSVITKVKPDEIYHLAAQSHVKISFLQPSYTFQTIVNSTLSILEIIKNHLPHTKLYHAASSEMFGNTNTAFQNEDTPMNPVSPYGIAKLAAYNLVKCYRHSYKLFASNGILFNHESIPKNSPILIRKDKAIDILPIEEIFKLHRYDGLKEEFIGSEVWNGTEWTKIISGTCYKDKEKKLKLVQTRSSSFEATLDHTAFMEDNSEKPTSDIKVNDKLFTTIKPVLNTNLVPDKALCKFIGFVVGDGYISEEGKIRLVGINKEELINISDLICNQFGWTYKETNKGPGQYDGCIKDIWNIDLYNNRDFGLWLRSETYTNNSREKRIPKFILNASNECKKAFIEGYYQADGRKIGNEAYKYKGFTTKSATLALSLNIIFESVYNQTVKCKCEYRDGNRYYYTQLRSPIVTNKGQHLIRPLNEVIKIIDTITDDGWFYDIQTESQTFATGPNLSKIHNSPRRSSTFVTTKIVKGLVEIKHKKLDKLVLGNVATYRDWGHAKDYAKVIHQIMQLDKPDDYVCATGTTRSPWFLMQYVCKKLDIDFDQLRNDKKIIVHDSKFNRENELHCLQGSTDKLSKAIDLKFEYTFESMIDETIEFWEKKCV